MKSSPHSRIVVIDVETTGLSPRNGDRVIEIGAIAFENRTVVEEFSTLIDTNRTIPAQVQRIHGITQEMLKGKPKPEEVMPEFAAFIRGSVLVAHNARFDMAFIRHEFSRQKLSFNHRCICTLEMSQRRFPQLPNHKLANVYRHVLGTDGDAMRSGTCSGSPQGADCVHGMSASWPVKPQTHRALHDARMVAVIWLAMEER